MKNLLIVLSIVFLQNQTYGQVEFAPEGAEWCFKTTGGFLPYYGNTQCAVSSDTIVQGKDGKVIECSTVGYLDMPCCDTIYWQGHFIVHQSGDSIFDYTDFSGFKFLFRNDLTLGEVTMFPELYSYPLKVEEVESGTIGNVTVKNFKLHDEVNDIFASNLYDRIGPDRGFFDHWDAAAWDGGSFFLRWYKDAEMDTLFVASEPCGVVTPVSTFERQYGSISIFPNPAIDVLHLDFPVTQANEYQVEVFNLTGQSLLKEKGGGNQIKVSQLPAGLYVLMIDADGKIYREKFVKN